MNDKKQAAKRTKNKNKILTKLLFWIHDRIEWCYNWVVLFYVCKNSVFIIYMEQICPCLQFIITRFKKTPSKSYEGAHEFEEE